MNTSNHSQPLNLLNDLEKNSNQFNKLTNQKMSLIFKSDYQTGIHKYAEYLVVPENGLYKPSNLRINHSIRNYLPEEQKARIPIYRVPSNRRYHQTELDIQDSDFEQPLGEHSKVLLSKLKLESECSRERYLNHFRNQVSRRRAYLLESKRLKKCQSSKPGLSSHYLKKFHQTARNEHQ